MLKQEIEKAKERLHRSVDNIDHITERMVMRIAVDLVLSDLERDLVAKILGQKSSGAFGCGAGEEW